MESRRFWQRLEVGIIKINCDGGWEKETRRSTANVVIRDHKGIFFAARSVVTGRSQSSMMVELMALSEAVKLASQLQYRRVIFESDSSQVIKLIQSNGESFHPPSPDDCRFN